MLPETLQTILDYDSLGFMPFPGESGSAFVARVEEILARHAALNAGLKENGCITLFGDLELAADEQIGSEIIEEAADCTWDLYRFRSNHVPGFFLSRSVGLLWGGCMISDPDENCSVFLIRNAFRTRKRWLFYRRNELLAHELCHSMHQNLNEQELEEFFAYQTSPSALRRYLGNCFIRDLDALLFILPALLLLAAVLLQSFWFPRIPALPFWILALVYPAYLLLRNAVSRKKVFRAREKLESFGYGKVAMAILFRCRCEELDALGSLPDAEHFRNYVEHMAENELRWKIILHRFILEDEAVSDAEEQSSCDSATTMEQIAK